MQEKKQNFVSVILDRIIKHSDLTDLQDLADYLGVSRNNLYSWIHRGSIGNRKLLLAKFPYLNEGWLVTGSGPMFLIDENNIDALPDNWPPPPTTGNKVKATIEPGSERLRQNIERQKNTEQLEDNDQWSVEELLQMTREVLESHTVYRPALAANVKAFYKAIKTEDEMNSITEEVRALRMENQAVNNRMERMEQMLLSLGATLPQKRDQANG